MAIEKTPERAAAGSNPLLAQLCNGLLERQVWMLSNHSQDLGHKLFKRRNTSAARLRRGAVIIAPALQPLDRRGYAHLKTFGRLAPRCARSHSFDNAYPQVTRISLWHCPPPTVRRINAQKTPSSLTVWESPDSNRAKTALVNNAGIGVRGPIELTPVAVFRQVMETNFFGGLRCTKAVMPSMRERRSGCIINVTSVAGQFGMSPQGAYASSKWAFEGLSECLAQELSPFNVRVAIVEPGVIATPLTTTARPVPPPNPYSMHGRRLGAYFVASLRNPTSPFEIAKTIQDIVDGKSTKLRNPTGADGATLINWRKNKTDEEWVALGAASDDEWVADARKNTGMDVKLL